MSLYRKFFLLLVMLFITFLSVFFSPLSLSFSSSVSIPLHSFVADSSYPLLFRAIAVSHFQSLSSFKLPPIPVSSHVSLYPKSSDDSHLNYADTVISIYKGRTDYALMSCHTSDYSVSHIHTWECKVQPVLQ